MFISGPLSQWREEVGRNFLNLDFEPAAETPFNLSMNLLFRSEGVGIGHTRHSPGETFRDHELIQRDGSDSVSLILSAGPLHLVSQARRETVISGGEAAIVLNASSGAVASRSNANYFGIIIPASAFEEAGVRTGDLVGRTWRRSNGALKLLKSYVRTIKQQQGSLSPGVLAASARHVSELAGLAAREAVRGPTAQPMSPRRDTLLALILAAIDRSLTDPRLSVASIAAELHLSLRYVHVLMEGAGLSFVPYVTALRLEKVARDLREPALCAWTIADVAFNAGFSDISHFNRVFRRTFGVTPRAYRDMRPN